MKFASAAALLAALTASSSLTSASPVLRRQDTSASSIASPTETTSPTSTASVATETPSPSGGAFNSSSDTDILKYALTLEHLEAAFYNESLGRFSEADFEAAGVNGSYRNQIYSIGRDEAAHVSLLTAALVNDTVLPCTYNWTSVTDVRSFLATARLLEGVGISAYLGAAGSIVSKTYLEIAGAILSVEGRHQSALNAIVNGPNIVPSAYDTPLNFTGVYSLAASYIDSCPTNLGLLPFPSLSLSTNETRETDEVGELPNTFSPGSNITVTVDERVVNTTSSENATYIALISGVTSTDFFELGENMTFTLPETILGGQFYAVLTTSNTTVTDDNTLAGPAVGYVDIPIPVAPEPTATASASGSAVPTSTEDGTMSINPIPTTTDEAENPDQPGEETRTIDTLLTAAASPTPA